jgi:4-hydroxybenzoate polyprenyltransferase
MRGAGCTYNDIVDRDLDERVERTRQRPLPSGQVTLKAALAFLGLQCLVGLLVLLQFNGFAIATGFASLGVVALYPFMKRFFWMPQIVLGLAFSWGALMGWAAAFGSLSWAAILLYAGSIAWVVGYDTIYALQDIEDDEIAGIKSSARFFGERVRLGVGLCYGLAILFMIPAFVLARAGPAAFLGLGLFALHLGWQVTRIDRNDGAGALRLFRANRDAGLILFAAMFLDCLIRQ